MHKLRPGCNGDAIRAWYERATPDPLSGLTSNAVSNHQSRRPQIQLHRLGRARRERLVVAGRKGAGRRLARLGGARVNANVSVPLIALSPLISWPLIFGF